MVRLSDKLLIGCLVILVMATISCTPSHEMSDSRHKRTSQPLPTYTFSIVNVYPHDRDAFTQGLAIENGTLYEGTGLYGKSSLRRVELTSGDVLQVYALPDEYFGEGITVFNDRIIQLTWQCNRGFVYDKKSFELLREFTYETEGWGITHDGKRLIMSDGTSTLYFLNAGTFEISGHLQVHDNSKEIDNLNELEFIDGQIYANIWSAEKIAIIDPQSGCVTGWLDLAGILARQSDRKPENVLNGIAHDATTGRLFVTGKLWPQLFEIKLRIAD